MGQARAVFLDRDNTIIEDRVYLNDPEDLTYLPGAFEALKKLQDAGYKLIIVTNQSGVPRGLVQLSNLHQIHKNIRAAFSQKGVDFAGVYYSPFLPSSNHPSRKPNPGMLLEAAKDHNIDLSQSWMVGDRHSDVEAGHRAGTRSIFLEGSEAADSSPYEPPFGVAENLLKMAEIILSNPA